MKDRRAACLLLTSLWYGSPALGQDEPDALLTIPHILKTPLISSFRLSPSGDQVALDISLLGKQAIWLIDVGAEGENAGGRPIRTERGWAERDVDWSPDGKAIAFVSSRNRSGDGVWQLYVAAPDGTKPRRLTIGALEVNSPRWAPDGKHIAFLGRSPDSSSGWDLWTIPADGGEPKKLTEEPFDEDDPRWSPDGKRIALSLNGGRHQPRRVGIVTVADGELAPLLPSDWTGDTYGARWSPDGASMVFVSDQPGVKSLLRVGVPETAPADSTPERIRTSELEQYAPAWSPDGRYIAYLENRDGDVKLRLHDLESDRDRTMTLRNGVHTAPAFHPDGSAVLSLFEAWNYPRDVWSYPIEGGRARVSDTLPPDLDVRKMIRPELVRYPSTDGVEVSAYLYVPEGASGSNPAPLVVHPHGGPTSQWQNEWHPFVQLLAQNGFAIFAPNVRGSSGYGVTFENLNDGAWGQGDLEDLMAGTRFVAARPEIRDDRIGIWGVSYGGFLTLAAITRYPDFFACAVEAVGMPDLEALYRRTTDEGRRYLEREIGPLRGHLQLYRDLSPVRDVASVQTPLLSFHGEIYPLVPWSTKEPFLAELRKRAGYPLLDFIFKGDEVRATYRHDLHPGAAYAYVEKVLEFLGIYL